MTKAGVIPINDYQFGLLMNCAREHPMAINKCESLSEIRKQMRAACPKEGDDVERWMTVFIPSPEQGTHLPSHSHDEHTMLFYPADIDDSPLIIDHGDDEERIFPRCGDVYHLPPNTKHWVGRTTSPRLSVAMLVKV